VYFCYNVFGGSNTKIFMGDSGSLLVGYLLTAFVFRFCEINAYHSVPEALQMSAAPAVAICIMAVPLFDTVRVSVSRIMHKRSPLLADKNHVHHLLLQLGLSHIQTTCILLLVTLILTAIAVIGRNWNIYLLTLAALAVYTCLIAGIKLILHHKHTAAQEQHDKH